MANNLNYQFSKLFEFIRRGNHPKKAELALNYFERFISEFDDNNSKQHEVKRSRELLQDLQKHFHGKFVVDKEEALRKVSVLKSALDGLGETEL